MSRTTWTHNEMLLNVALMYPLVFLGGYILWEKARPIFWAYMLTWFGILTVGRYFVCRPCPYYGQDCPSFGFGHLARIFPESKTKGFNRRAGIIDTSVIVASLLIPIVLWILGIFTRIVSLSVTDHIVMGVYLGVFITMGLVHDAGCRKCDIAECPMSKAPK